ncbi:MAG TPA: PleD family two-component system response regulator [Thermosynechococcaceae cyanobacterium]
MNSSDPLALTELIEGSPLLLRRSPLILLVDDDSFVRIQVRRFLEKERYQVVEANNGQEGLEQFKQLHPDLVLMDAVMPVLDGFESCAALQALPEAERIPVLMITGLDDQASVDRAFAVGAVDYVTKPIHWAVLRQRVKRLIQQAQIYQQLEAANRILQRLASVDDLTQLANRRQFDLHLEQEWRRMARDQASLSVILCDVDFFKRYNDSNGHQSGDECLRQVARTIAMAARRAGDLAARYGGEEFAIILPSVDESGAMQVAQLIRSRLREMEIPHPSSPISPFVTLSSGVASFIPAQNPDLLPGTLVSAADRALYQAKAMGRDHVRGGSSLED